MRNIMRAPVIPNPYLSGGLYRAVKDEIRRGGWSFTTDQIERVYISKGRGVNHYALPIN